MIFNTTENAFGSGEDLRKQKDDPIESLYKHAILDSNSRILNIPS